jgi:four helix bundle protein
MKISRFEDLECWQQARILAKMVYTAINKSKNFKRDFRLSGEAAESAVSVMSNIAEGFSRQTNREFIQFLYISKSSASEVQSVFYVALDQDYIDHAIFERVYNQADKVCKMNSGLIKYLSSQFKKVRQPK